MYYDEYKHYDRIELLEDARYSYCGLDTRNVKLLLNKLAKNDPIAESYRIALEIEDCNIKAKKYRGSYRLDYYELKDQYIKELSKLCKDNGWLYGWQKADTINVPYLVYFELYNCELISFHTKTNFTYFPKYKKEWDGKEDSTLEKLEIAITNQYKNELLERKKYLDSTADLRLKNKLKRYEKQEQERIRKEQEEQKRLEEWELIRKLRLIDSSSTDKMNKRYDEFINSLSAKENTGKYVKIRYNDNGVFVSEDNLRNPFNLFVWENDTILYYPQKGHINLKYFDEFILVYKILKNNNTHDIINIYKIEYLHEIEDIKNKKKQELKEKTKLIRDTENILLKKNNITKTLYKSLISLIKNTGNNTHWNAVKTDNGLFYILNNNEKLYFNFVLNENNKITKYDKNNKCEYIPVNKCQLYTVADNKRIY